MRIKKKKNNCCGHSDGACEFLSFRAKCDLFNVDLEQGGFKGKLKFNPLSLRICDKIYGDTYAGRA